MGKKLNLEDIKQECLKHEVECLEEEYINNKIKMKFKCKCGNVYEAPWAKVTSRNQWQCPKCSGKEKLNLEDIKKECLKHNIECLEEKYVNNATKMKFKCKCGNVYEARWRDIKSHNQWQCPKCSGNEKLNLEDIKKECKEHGVECLEERYENNYTKMKFRCKCGNIYEAAWNIVKRNNQWQCSKCSKAMPRGEVLTQKYLDSKNILYTTQDSLGCTNPKTDKNLPFDFVIRNNNETIIIEIDGEQHYRSVEYFGGEKGFESTQYRDDIKNEFCKNNGYKLYRIRWQGGDDEEKLIQQLENIMKENNLI